MLAVAVVLALSLLPACTSRSSNPPEAAESLVSSPQNPAPLPARPSKLPLSEARLAGKCGVRPNTDLELVRLEALAETRVELRAQVPGGRVRRDDRRTMQLELQTKGILGGTTISATLPK